VAEQSSFVTRHGRPRYCIALEGFYLTALCSILGKGGAALPCQVLLEAVVFNGSRSKNSFIEFLYVLNLLQLIALTASVAVAAFGISYLILYFHNYEL
jgi:hypothetical protein